MLQLFLVLVIQNWLGVESLLGVTGNIEKVSLTYCHKNCNSKPDEGAFKKRNKKIFSPFLSCKYLLQFSLKEAMTCFLFQIIIHFVSREPKNVLSFFLSLEYHVLDVFIIFWWDLFWWHKVIA